MEVHKIESLLEKYFEGNTSISEEKELKNYFLSDKIVPHLLKYKELFVFYFDSKNEQFSKEMEMVLPIKPKNNLKWMSIVACFVVLCTVATFVYTQFDNLEQENLGTFDNPEEAMVATHKALQLVANNLNTGIKSVYHIEEYENTKKIIFK